MKSSEFVSRYSSGYPLGQLALDSAIELENIHLGRDTSVVALKQLTVALNTTMLSDLTLVPIYDRALTIAVAHSPTRNDFDNKLREMVASLEQPNSASSDQVIKMRDFCLALHESLVNAQFAHLQQSAVRSQPHP